MEKGKLRPKSYNVYIVYECPGCHGDEQFTLRENQLVGSAVCMCGEHSVFDKIEKLEIIPHFAGRVTVPTPPEDSDFALVRWEEEATIALEGLGCKNSEAKNKVQEASKDYDFDHGSVEDFVKHVIRCI